METKYITLAIVLIAGFIGGWSLRTIALASARKNIKNLRDSLVAGEVEQKKLEQAFINLQQLQDRSVGSFDEKIFRMELQQKKMEEQVAMLRDKNEETKALLHAGNPVIHQLKLKLIEANNTIARYKAKLGS